MVEGSVEQHNVAMNDTTKKTKKNGDTKSSHNLAADPPPTNATCGGEHRRKRLIPKSKVTNPLKYKSWVIGHSLCIGFGIISLTYQLLRLPNKWWIGSIVYRLSLLGAVIALTATFSHKFGLHFLPPLSLLLSQQNFQFLVLGIIWMCTFQSVFKLSPFVAISCLQLADKYDVKVINDASPFIAAGILGSEVCLTVSLLLRTLYLNGTSGYQLLIYFFFYWLRVLFDPATRTHVKSQVDSLGKFVKGKNEKAESIITFILQKLEAQSSEGEALLADLPKRK